MVAAQIPHAHILSPPATGSRGCCILRNTRALLRSRPLCARTAAHREERHRAGTQLCRQVAATLLQAEKLVNLQHGRVPGKWGRGGSAGLGQRRTRESHQLDDAKHVVPLCTAAGVLVGWVGGAGTAPTAKREAISTPCPFASRLPPSCPRPRGAQSSSRLGELLAVNRWKDRTAVLGRGLAAARARGKKAVQPRESARWERMLQAGRVLTTHARPRAPPAHASAQPKFFQPQRASCSARPPRTHHAVVDLLIQLVDEVAELPHGGRQR